MYLFISIYDPVIFAEVIHGNNLFKEPYMSLSSHVHHFALVISIYDLVIFIDVLEASRAASEGHVHDGERAHTTGRC